ILSFGCDFSKYKIAEKCILGRNLQEKIEFYMQNKHQETLLDKNRREFIKKNVYLYDENIFNSFFENIDK
ncbi:TPA: hypothetical protein R1740_000510, partial [Campylobacter lari]|nr:hypothetical protein [Campylobacter lari]